MDSPGSARPSSREQFRVAIICALPRESNAVTLLFDAFFARNDSGQPYSKAPGDTNYYTLGRIGQHDVVLTTLPEMGITSAAVASANLQVSFTGLRLVLLLGICGGVPIVSRRNVFMGDVVISRSVVQYDYGRQYPGHFMVKKKIEDSLGRASRDIRSLISHLQGEHNKEQLCKTAAAYLKDLQDKARSKRREATYTRPSFSEDILYRPDYLHKCHNFPCKNCTGDETLLCDEAMGAYCAELGCANDKMTTRQERSDDPDDELRVLIGRIGSGNTVMKSAMERDRIAKAHNLIAFEMEAAGAWEDLPCLVVKGVCDYADSHKSDIWQDFAAATAACVGKAILDFYGTEQPSYQVASPDNTLNGLPSAPTRMPVDVPRSDLPASILSTTDHALNSSLPSSRSGTPATVLSPDVLSPDRSIPLISAPTSSSSSSAGFSTDGDSSPPPPYRPMPRIMTPEHKASSTIEGIAYKSLHLICNIYSQSSDLSFSLISSTFKELGGVIHTSAGLELLLQRQLLKTRLDASSETAETNYYVPSITRHKQRRDVPLSRRPQLPEEGLTGALFALQELATIGLRALARVFPQPHLGTWGHCESLILHALQTIEWAYCYRCDEQLARTPLVARVAEYLRQRGRYDETVGHFERILGVRQCVLGNDHASTLMTRTRLARVLNAQMQHRRAEKLASSVLRVQRARFGNRATDTIKTMVTLAISCRCLGRDREALSLVNEALVTQRERLGSNHAETLMSERQLALIWCNQGLREPTESLLRNIIDRQKKLLGEKDPDTMVTIHSLGYVYIVHGYYETARKHISRAVELQTEVLGESHPDTLYSMGSLATACRMKGLHAEAREVSSKVLALRREVSGRKHPAALAAMHDLALSKYELGQHQEAISLMHDCYKLRTEVLGNAEAETMGSAGMLHDWKAKMGK